MNRPTGWWWGLAALAAGLFAGCGAHSATTGAFTRDNVLAKLRQQYPQIALPADGPVAGVESRLDIVYLRRGEGALALDVFVPTGAGPYPAVIIIHGGGWKSGERAMERPFARQLAARGFVTATVSYRLGPAGRFPGALLDVKAAVRWLRAHAAEYRIDAAHIGAVGASSGGQLVALAGASNGAAEFEEGDGSVSSALAAVVDIDGLANFAAPELIVRETRAAGAPTLFLGGPFSTRAAVWRAASALSHVGPQSAPTLFINSTASTARISPSPMLPGRLEMRDRLRALGLESDIVLVPNTPHPFWLLEPWFIPTVEESAHSLRRHLAACPRIHGQAAYGDLHALLPTLAPAARLLVPHRRDSDGLVLVPDGDDCVAPRLRTYGYAPSSRLVLPARPGASTHHIPCDGVLVPPL